MNLKNQLVRCAASFGFIGHIRYMPGTMACLPLLVWALLKPNPTGVLVLGFTSTLVGLIICRAAIKVYQLRDPRPFVTDEVAGFAITLAWLPLDPILVWAGFFLFRFLDIVKPIGIRKVDQMKLPESIMLDDMLAGVYANIILRVIFVLIPQVLG